MTDQSSLDLPIPRSRPRFPVEPIVRAAEIEDNYRWTATRAWGAGPGIHWNMLNPSIADGRRDDPTMSRIIGFSYRWGFGWAVVTNIYPFISANTAALNTWRASWNQEAAKAAGFNWDLDHSAFNAWIKNMHVVSAAMAGADVHVAAWGNGADAEDLDAFLDGARPSVDTSEHDGFGMVKVPVEWMCLGKTGLGAPIHPLARGAHRVPDDAVLQSWRSS